MAEKKNEVLNDSILADLLYKALEPLNELTKANVTDKPDVKLLIAINQCKITATDIDKSVGDKAGEIITTLRSVDDQGPVQQCINNLTELQRHADLDKSPGALNEETLKNALQPLRDLALSAQTLSEDKKAKIEECMKIFEDSTENMSIQAKTEAIFEVLHGQSSVPFNASDAKALSKLSGLIHVWCARNNPSAEEDDFYDCRGPEGGL